MDIPLGTDSATLTPGEESLGLFVEYCTTQREKGWQINNEGGVVLLICLCLAPHRFLGELLSKGEK